MDQIILGQKDSGNDTVRLLRQCDSGVKMGISSIEDVLDDVQSRELYSGLRDSLQEHHRLEKETRALLRDLGEPDRDPPAMARGMSKIKTELKMMTERKDAAVADLIVDGCNMGVKSLSKYLNQYQAADTQSRDIAKKLIAMESDLSLQMRSYL